MATDPLLCGLLSGWEKGPRATLIIEFRDGACMCVCMWGGGAASLILEDVKVCDLGGPLEKDYSFAGVEDESEIRINVLI